MKLDSLNPSLKAEANYIDSEVNCPGHQMIQTIRNIGELPRPSGRGDKK